MPARDSWRDFVRDERNGKELRRHYGITGGRAKDLFAASLFHHGAYDLQMCVSGAGFWPNSLFGGRCVSLRSRGYLRPKPLVIKESGCESVSAIGDAILGISQLDVAAWLALRRDLKAKPFNFKANFMQRPASRIVFSMTVLALGLLVVSSSWAQTTATDSIFLTVEPKTAGFDAEKLSELDALFSKDVEDEKMFGCMALVARNNEVVYAKTFGMRNQERELPVTEDSIYRIYSMSKPITSVAIMMLVEEGKIELDAPVSKYLPEMANLKVLEEADGEDGEAVEVDAKREITVRDLLRHTSGLTYGFFGNTGVDQKYRAAGLLSRNPDLADFVTKLSKIPLQYQPGTRFHYSVSTDVLGRVVEVASGQGFDEFLAERIFEPLKMVDTFFTVPKDKQDRFAQMYSRRDGSLRPANALSSYRFLNENDFHSGGGGLCSTTRDYYRFCQMLVNDGELEGVRLLKPETIQEMTKNQLEEIGGSSRGFQFGLGFSIDGQGRYGWGGAAGTRFWVDPVNDVIGIFMVQINPYDGGNYERSMKQIVYAAMESDE